jgi:hypothetical protein
VAVAGTGHPCRYWPMDLAGPGGYVVVAVVAAVAVFAVAEEGCDAWPDLLCPRPTTPMCKHRLVRDIIY